MMIEEHGYLASSSYVTFRFNAEHNEFGVRALSNRQTLSSRLGKLVQQLFPQSFNVRWSENMLPDGAELRVWSTRQKLISLTSGTKARNIAHRYSGLPFQWYLEQELETSKIDVLTFKSFAFWKVILEVWGAWAGGEIQNRLFASWNFASLERSLRCF